MIFMILMIFAAKIELFFTVGLFFPKNPGISSTRKVMKAGTKFYESTKDNFSHFCHVKDETEPNI